MDRRLLLLVIFLVPSLLFGACAPAAAPPSVPPASTPASIPVPAAANKPLVPQDDPWARVVAEAKKEGRVTLYTFLFTGDVGKEVSRAFEDKYGIKLEFVTGIGTILIERIKAEQRAGRFIADTLDTAVSLVAIAKEDGLTASMGELPALADKDIWALSSPRADPEGHIIGIRPTTLPFWINTTAIKPGEEPRSYRDLVDTRWGGGKLGLSSPVTAPNSIWIYLTTRKNGSLDDDFWRRLGRQQLRLAPSVRETPSWLARGEIAASFVDADSSMAPYVKEGAPLKAVEMSEGVLVAPQSVSIALAKNGPHPNAARVFTNWYLGQEGQSLYARAVGGYYPLRKDTPDIRPPALRVEIKKALLVDLPVALESAKMQREGTLAKLMGVEK